MRRHASSEGKKHRGPAAHHRPPDSPNGSPSLAELRRRAIQHLRTRAGALDKARREYEAAADECARLRAGTSDGENGRPDTGEGHAADEPRRRVAEEQRKAEEAAAAAEAERVHRHEAEEASRALLTELQAARDALARERSRAEGLERQIAKLRDTKEQLGRELAAQQQSGDEHLRAEIALVSRQLEQSRAHNEQLRANMRELLGFLDRLSEILSAATPDGSAKT